MASAGYSGTPLAKKLGLKSGIKVSLVNQPEYYSGLIGDLPADIEMTVDTSVKKNFIHYFVKSAEDLRRDILWLKTQIVEDGVIWISWPKKASQIKTDVNEDVIRNIALLNGLVDIKVCAIDEIWSGLKLVIPVKDRGKK